MKLLISQSSLQTSLASAGRIISTRSQLPVLEMIKLEAEKKTLSVYATDLSMGTITTTMVKTTTGGSCVVPYKLFSTLVSSLPQTDVELEVENNTLNITAGSIKTKILLGETEEYPEFPKLLGKKFSISTKDLDLIETFVSFSAARDLVRPVLSSLFFNQQNNHLEVASTDGLRLSVKLFSNQPLPVLKFLLPSRALQEIQRIKDLSQPEIVEFEIVEEQQSVVCKIGNTQFFSRLVVGDYPPYSQIIPQEFKTSVSLHKASFEENVKRSLLFGENKEGFFQLIISREKTEVFTKNSAGETLQADIEALNFWGDPISISFSSRLVLDFLRAVEDEFIELSVNNPLKPALFTIKSIKDYKFVVMPFRMREE